MQPNYWSRITDRRVNRRRALAFTGAGALSAAFLAACGGSDSGGEEKDSSSLVTQPVDTLKTAKRGGILKDRAFADPPTLDMTTPNNPITIMAYNVYSMLVSFKPGYMKPSEMDLDPDLAESWEYSPDGLQITMKIRQGVKWHNKAPVNGRALEMDDILATWNRFATKYSGRAGVVNAADPSAPVLSVTATDNRTLVIKLKEPLVYALALFTSTNASGPIIIPKETENGFDPRGDMIGTGPFMLTNYTPSVGFTFKRNPEYYDKDWALVDQIDLPIISEYTAALSQLRAGNIYLFGQNTGTVVKPEDILPLKQEEPRLSLYQGDFANGGVIGRSLNFGWLPAGKSPFLDERVRQAISMSWDRDLYMDTFLNVNKFKSQGIPVESRWNTALPANVEGWWLDPKSKDFGPNAKYFEHNLTEAKKLLAAAGHPNGFDFTSHYVTTSELGTTPNHAEVIDGFARELGLKVSQHSVDYLKEYAPNFRDGRGQFDGWSYVSTAGGTTGGSAIGMLAIEYWSKGGAAFKGFSNSGQNDQSGDPQVDSLIEKARLELDTEKRKALVNDIQRYLAKPWYSASLPGYATGLTVAWPALGNFRVWQGGRPNYRFWVDDTKAPLAKT